MPFQRLFVIALLGLSPAICAAQKPLKYGKMNTAHTTGKGTPAYLSHHKDMSAAVLHQNTRTGAAADLSKLEKQSLHSAGAGSAPKRAHAAALPKSNVAKGDHNTQINFSGRSAPRGLTMTNQKSSGRAQTPPKPH